MTAQAGYLVTRALEREKERRERKGERERGEEGWEVSALTVIWHALSVFLWIIVGRARCTLCKSIVPPFLNAARYGLLRSQPRFIRRLVRDAPGNACAIRATIIFSRGRGEGDAVYPKSILPSFLPSFLPSLLLLPQISTVVQEGTAGTNIGDVNRFFSTRKYAECSRVGSPRWAGKRWQRGRTKCCPWIFAVHRKNRQVFSKDFVSFRFVRMDIGMDARRLSLLLVFPTRQFETSTSFPRVIFYPESYILTSVNRWGRRTGMEEGRVAIDRWELI